MTVTTIDRSTIGDLAVLRIAGDVTSASEGELTRSIASRSLPCTPGRLNAVSAVDPASVDASAAPATQADHRSVTSVMSSSCSWSGPVKARSVSSSRSSSSLPASSSAT